jgi:hypothetical protein
VVDRNLKEDKDSFDVAKLESSVDVIIQCTQTNPILRPKMSKVLHALEAYVMIAKSSIELNRELLPYVGTYSFSVRHEDSHDSSSSIILEDNCRRSCGERRGKNDKNVRNMYSLNVFLHVTNLLGLFAVHIEDHFEYKIWSSSWSFWCMLHLQFGLG